jgi:hypothetical protein
MPEAELDFERKTSKARVQILEKKKGYVASVVVVWNSQQRTLSWFDVYSNTWRVQVVRKNRCWSVWRIYTHTPHSHPGERQLFVSRKNHVWLLIQPEIPEKTSACWYLC